MIDYYESNLKILKKNHLHLWKQITENPPDPVGEVIFTPDGKYNIKIQMIFKNIIFMMIKK